MGSLGQVLPLCRSQTHVPASSDGKKNGRWRQAGVLMSVHLEASTDQAATGGGDVSRAPDAAAQRPDGSGTCAPMFSWPSADWGQLGTQGEPGSGATDVVSASSPTQTKPAGGQLPNSGEQAQQDGVPEPIPDETSSPEQAEDVEDTAAGAPQQPSDVGGVTQPQDGRSVHRRVRHKDKAPPLHGVFSPIRTINVVDMLPPLPTVIAQSPLPPKSDGNSHDAVGTGGEPDAPSGTSPVTQLAALQGKGFNFEAGLGLVRSKASYSPPPAIKKRASHPSRGSVQSTMSRASSWHTLSAQPAYTRSSTGSLSSVSTIGPPSQEGRKKRISSVDVSDDRLHVLATKASLYQIERAMTPRAAQKCISHLKDVVRRGVPHTKSPGPPKGTARRLPMSPIRSPGRTGFSFGHRPQHRDAMPQLELGCGPGVTPSAAVARVSHTPSPTLPAAAQKARRSRLRKLAGVRYKDPLAEEPQQAAAKAIQRYQAEESRVKHVETVTAHPDKYAAAPSKPLVASGGQSPELVALKGAFPGYVNHPPRCIPQPTGAHTHERSCGCARVFVPRTATPCAPPQGQPSTARSGRYLVPDPDVR